MLNKNNIHEARQKAREEIKHRKSLTPQEKIESFNKTVGILKKPEIHLSDNANAVLTLLLSLSLTEQASILRYLANKYEYDIEDVEGVNDALKDIAGMCGVSYVLEELDRV